MALITNCRVCGERISLRKMRAGQYVAFEVATDVQHEHVKKKSISEIKKPPKEKVVINEPLKEIKNEEVEEIKKPIFQENSYNENQTKTNFQEIKRIHTSTEKKSSNFSLLIPICIILIVGYFLLK